MTTRESRPGGYSEAAPVTDRPDQVHTSIPRGGSRGQVPPVGEHPDVDVLFVGSLLWSAPASAVDVLPLVLDDDLESPALAAVLAACRRLVSAGKPHFPQLVLDELQRTGELKSLVADELRIATTSGADIGTAVRYYAAAVVAVSLRRRIAAAGDMLTVSAYETAEANLAPLVDRAASAIQDCAERLEALRGEGS